MQRWHAKPIIIISPISEFRNPVYFSEHGSLQNKQLRNQSFHLISKNHNKQFSIFKQTAKLYLKQGKPFSID